MSKPKKNKKTSLASIAKNAREAILRRAINILVLAIFLAVVFLLGKAYIYRSDYFKLRKVEVKETLMDPRCVNEIRSRILNANKNKSVFRIDLKEMANVLRRTYKDSKDVYVTLELPDKLVVSLKVRRAVLQVRADKLYPVDEEGVILPAVDILALKWVPVVDGVQVSAEDRRRMIIDSRNLRASMVLLRGIANAKPVADQGIESIDVKDLGNIVFYLKNGIEVRIGGEDFKERLNVLAKTLKDPRLIMERIKYIDLRFGDAVIGPK